MKHVCHPTLVTSLRHHTFLSYSPDTLFSLQPPDALSVSHLSQSHDSYFHLLTCSSFPNCSSQYLNQHSSTCSQSDCHGCSVAACLYFPASWIWTSLPDCPPVPLPALFLYLASIPFGLHHSKHTNTSNRKEKKQTSLVWIVNPWGYCED